MSGGCIDIGSELFGAASLSITLRPARLRFTWPPSAKISPISRGPGVARMMSASVSVSTGCRRGRQAWFFSRGLYRNRVWVRGCNSRPRLLKSMGEGYFTGAPGAYRESVDKV